MVVYIVVKQPPIYHQMTLEEFLFKTTTVPGVINENLANTRTYEKEKVSENIARKLNINVDNLINCGVEQISVTVNYLKEQLEEHYEQPRNGVKIQTVREPKFLGTIGGLQFVPQFFHDTILLMNSDLFTNIDFEDFFLHFEEHQADMSAVAIPYSISVPYGIFNIENQREIQGIVEKPTYNYYANAGIYLIRREMLDRYIPKDTFFNATDFMEKLISEGRKVIRFPLSGYWIDIGNKQEYAKAQDLVKHL